MQGGKEGVLSSGKKKIYLNSTVKQIHTSSNHSEAWIEMHCQGNNTNTTPISTPLSQWHKRDFISFDLGLVTRHYTATDCGCINDV